jgi:hypothetical protein
MDLGTQLHAIGQPRYVEDKCRPGCFTLASGDSLATIMFERSVAVLGGGPIRDSLSGDLPSREREAAAQFVTFRLTDLLPANVQGGMMHDWITYDHSRHI